MSCVVCISGEKDTNKPTNGHSFTAVVKKNIKKKILVEKIGNYLLESVYIKSREIMFLQGLVCLVASKIT